MNGQAIPVAAIVMVGLLATVVAWQLLAIARTAVANKKEGPSPEELADLQARLVALESLQGERSPNT